MFPPPDFESGAIAFLAFPGVAGRCELARNNRHLCCVVFPVSSCHFRRGDDHVMTRRGTERDQQDHKIDEAGSRCRDNARLKIRAVGRRTEGLRPAD
jgi:hypothetical protein